MQTWALFSWSGLITLTAYNLTHLPHSSATGLAPPSEAASRATARALVALETLQAQHPRPTPRLVPVASPEPPVLTVSPTPWPPVLQGPPPPPPPPPAPVVAGTPQPETSSETSEDWLPLLSPPPPLRPEPIAAAPAFA